MDEREWEKRLRDEGFDHTFVWQDGPGAAYPDHAHEGVTAHIIIDGEMTVASEGRSVTYRAGERFDVPAGAVHRARMGAAGCRYVVGEK